MAIPGPAPSGHRWSEQNASRQCQYRPCSRLRWWLGGPTIWSQRQARDCVHASTSTPSLPLSLPLSDTHSPLAHSPPLHLSPTSPFASAASSLRVRLHRQHRGRTDPDARTTGFRHQCSHRVHCQNPRHRVRGILGPLRRPCGTDHAALHEHERLRHQPDRLHHVLLRRDAIPRRRHQVLGPGRQDPGSPGL